MRPVFKRNEHSGETQPVTRFHRIGNRPVHGKIQIFCKTPVVHKLHALPLPVRFREIGQQGPLPRVWPPAGDVAHIQDPGFIPVFPGIQDFLSVPEVGKSKQARLRNFDAVKYDKTVHVLQIGDHAVPDVSQIRIGDPGAGDIGMFEGVKVQFLRGDHSVGLLPP
ncbi:hypothetical protein BMS3Abin05_00034 [bacterium BMS3Abin05]|nr:hypothetical protein BMS3Abin05_00034 [bacterium BMS3Abin05]